MPCKDSYSFSKMTDEEYRAMQDGPFKARIAILAEEVGMLTEFLCTLTKNVALDDIEDKTIRAWIRNHREWDKERKDKK